MKGTYVLKLFVGHPRKVRIGALGFLRFESGTYVYVGSALNSIEKRVQRHLKKEKILRWHLDYLTVQDDVEVIGVYVFENLEMEEELSLELSKMYKGVKGFGASDMKKADSNLYLVDESVDEFLRSLGGVGI